MEWPVTVEAPIDRSPTANASRPGFEYLTSPVLAFLEESGARRVLDIGCGTGLLCRQLHAEGYDVVGCDISSKRIGAARAKAPRVQFETLSVDDDPARLGGALFDVATAVEVVEHLYTPRNLAAFASKVLRPGGYLLVTTPYHGYLKNLALALSDRWDVHLEPLQAGGHIKFWSPRTLRRLGELEGFEYVRHSGAGRLPWLWKSTVMIFRASPLARR